MERRKTLSPEEYNIKKFKKCKYIAFLDENNKSIICLVNSIRGGYNDVDLDIYFTPLKKRSWFISMRDFNVVGKEELQELVDKSPHLFL